MSSSSGRRISPLRVLVVLAIVAGLAGLGYLGWQRADRAVDRITAGPSDTWFAPYADVTLVPSHAFEDAETSPAARTVLGFVVPDRREPCTPTWGANYDLEGAAGALDLDRRIARIRERGVTSSSRSGASSTPSSRLRARSRPRSRARTARSWSGTRRA